MQWLILTLFVFLTCGSFVASQAPALRLLKFAPEVFSGLILIYVIVEGTRRRFNLVAPKYWLTFAALALVIICGVASNQPAPGPMIAAIRLYVRALPLFLLPAVIDFTDGELRQQLKTLLWLSVLQLPLAVFQRWTIWSQGRFTGDPVYGTLLDSGALTIFLLAGAFLLTGLYLRRQIGRLPYFICLAALFLPTTINETKVTAIYLPLGMLVVLFVGSAPGRRLKMVGWGAAVLVVLVGVFLPIYSYFEARNPYAKQNTVTAIFSDEKKLDKYLNSNVKGLGTKKDVRRGDAIRVPIEYLAGDPIHLALGLGLGSVSPSTLGKSFEGRYHPLFSRFLITSFSYFLLEIGVLGLILIMVLYWLVISDAIAVTREGYSLLGGLSVGWVAVAGMLCLSLLYSTVHMVESLSYLYWYFSGTVAAQRMRAAGRRRELVHSSGTSMKV